MSAARWRRRASIGLALAVGLAACTCPPQRLDYDSPEAVLGSWQSQLCHAGDRAEDMRLEYRCLSAGLKTQIRGFETYVAARRRLLEENLLAASFLRYGDLAARAEERIETPDGRVRLVFEEGGGRFAIGFELETWVVASFDDGRPDLVARLPIRLGEALGRAGARQWIDLERPLLSEDQRAHLKSIVLEDRWKISAVDGLLDRAAPAEEIAP